MTLHQFTIFTAIARHKSLTRASEELHLTQPCVSQQMRLLQENYGAKLYERTAHGVELTEAGWRFLSAANRILEEVQRLKTSARRDCVKPEAHRLTVGGTYATSALLLPSLLARFKKLHPDTEIDLRTNHGTEIEHLLLKQKIELAITNRPPRSTRLSAEPFQRRRLALVVSKRHPLSRLRKVDLRQLEGMPVLIRAANGRDGATATRIITMIEQHGVKLSIGMRFEYPDALKDAIQRNLGIGLIFEDTVRHHLKCGEFKAISIKGLKLEGQSYIVYLTDKTFSTAASDFLNLLNRFRTQRKRTDLSRLVSEADGPLASDIREQRA